MNLDKLFQNPKEANREIGRHRTFLRNRMRARKLGQSYPKTRKALEEPEKLEPTSPRSEAGVWRFGRRGVDVY